MERLISFLGIFVFVGLCWLLSVNRKAIKWRTVAVGLSLQFCLGLLVLYWDAGNHALQSVSRGVASFLNLSTAGSEFVFGVTANRVAMEGAFGANNGFVFAFQVLPTIIFFSAFIAVLWHLGVMKWLVRGIARVMVRLMGTSGAESLAIASNIFVGQTEAPFLIKPFLAKMTKSELMAIMAGGYATIAGGVFALYVLFGVDAGHLMVASVLSAPAALVCAKIMYPETEQSETLGDVPTDMPKTSSNVVEAAANGTVDGLKLALNVGAMIIAFLGLVAVANWMLGGVNAVVGTAETAPGYYDALGPGGLTLQKIFGWIFSPFAFVLGVDWQDVPKVGQLLGTKIAVNELIGYSELKGFIDIGVLADLHLAFVDSAGTAPEELARLVKAGGFKGEDLSVLQQLHDALGPLGLSSAQDLRGALASAPEAAREQVTTLMSKTGLSSFDQLRALAGEYRAMSKRSIMISTYALCGFANLGSIGIQIGGIAALCPERRKDLAALAVRAMLAGAFASWMTASVAGIVASY